MIVHFFLQCFFPQYAGIGAVDTFASGEIAAVCVIGRERFVVVGGIQAEILFALFGGIFFRMFEKQAARALRGYPACEVVQIVCAAVGRIADVVPPFILIPEYACAQDTRC